MPDPGNVSLAAPQRRWKKKRYWMPVTVIALLAGFLSPTTQRCSRPSPRAGRWGSHIAGWRRPSPWTASMPTPAPPLAYQPAGTRLSGEHTIAGIQAAFDSGADQVEFDVHWTADGEFAAFHDRTLDCRTDGTTRDHERLPDMRVMSEQIMNDCLGRYEALGWTGAAPVACRHTGGALGGDVDEQTLGVRRLNETECASGMATVQDHNDG
jgi:hypothetical protein